MKYRKLRVDKHARTDRIVKPSADYPTPRVGTTGPKEYLCIEESLYLAIIKMFPNDRTNQSVYNKIMAMAHKLSQTVVEPSRLAIYYYRHPEVTTEEFVAAWAVETRLS